MIFSIGCGDKSRRSHDGNDSVETGEKNDIVHVCACLGAVFGRGSCVLLGVGLELGVGANSYVTMAMMMTTMTHACMCESDDAGLLARDIYCAGRGEEPPTGMGTRRFDCSCVDRAPCVECM